MKQVFLDTSYLQALVNKNDDLHQRAIEISETLEADSSVTKVTSEMVLTELLNALSKGQFLRQTALKIVETLQKNEKIEIVPQTSELFERAIKLYQGRPDKDYSLTDCASMVIMRERGISKVLTHDRHFAQEGFKALLRED